MRFTNCDNKIASLQLQDLIFGEEQCKVLTFRDITVVFELAKVKEAKENADEIATFISNEFLHRLRSVSQLMDNFTGLFDEDSVFQSHLARIQNTLNFMLSAAKSSLDLRLLVTGHFVPRLDEARI